MAIVSLFSQLVFKLRVGSVRRDRYRVIACKAGSTEVKGRIVGQLGDVVGPEKTERIDIQHFFHFSQGIVGRDQMLAGFNVGAEIARMQERRSGNAHMDLGCSGFAQKFDDAFACRAADDGIVDQNDTFAAYGRRDRIELDAKGAVPVSLIGLNKCSADVFVFDKAYVIRNSRLFCIAQGSVKP